MCTVSLIDSYTEKIDRTIHHHPSKCIGTICVSAEKGKDKENEDDSRFLARQNLLNARFRFQQLKVVD